LKEMNRLHTREYMTLIDKIRAIIRTARFHKILPVSLQTEQDHKDTLSLMEYVSITLVICIRTQNAQEH
jgi:hypothetical protein